MKDITLYYAPDNASLIIRMVLEELNLPYKTILVDRSVMQQQSDQYLQLNPTGLIPTCIIDGTVVTETAAIALYLAESTDTTLVPLVQTPARAACLRWLFFLSNTLHPDLRQLFYAEKYAGPEPDRQHSLRKMTRTRIGSNLKILDSEYHSSSHTWILQPEPTIVDIYLSVCLRWLQLYPLIDRGWFSLSDYPALKALTEAMQRRPAVIAASEAEGITGDFLSDARDASPTEGSAL